MNNVKQPFNKPCISWSEQVELLQQRGMVVDNPVQAAQQLSHINYYRLTGYWLPFQTTSNQFYVNTTFEDVVSLYGFDRRLRLCILNAIEHIEVSLRSTWAHIMAKHHGPHAHLNQNIAYNHKHWLNNMAKLKEEVERSKEAFIGHYIQKYSEPLPPIWVCSEVMSLGLLSKWYKIGPTQARRVIASMYALDDTVLTSWLEHLTIVRNICAHHGRLWNRTLSHKPKLSKNLKYQWADSRKIYNSLVIIIYLMDSVAPRENWRSTIKDLLKTLPTNQVVHLGAMGFPEKWEELSVWI